ncbi:MAG: hypothetical protein OEZ06_21050 [Myxococcales bacterium]|nr:hypothetical protein [Myxococcales bacterium]
MAASHNASCVPKLDASNFNHLRIEDRPSKRRPPAVGWRPPPHVPGSTLILNVDLAHALAAAAATLLCFTRA